MITVVLWIEQQTNAHSIITYYNNCIRYVLLFLNATLAIFCCYHNTHFDVQFFSPCSLLLEKTLYANTVLPASKLCITRLVTTFINTSQIRRGKEHKCFCQHKHDHIRTWDPSRNRGWFNHKNWQSNQATLTPLTTHLTITSELTADFRLPPTIWFSYQMKRYHTIIISWQIYVTIPQPRLQKGGMTSGLRPPHPEGLDQVAPLKATSLSSWLSWSWLFFPGDFAISPHCDCGVVHQSV